MRSVQGLTLQHGLCLGLAELERFCTHLDDQVQESSRIDILESRLGCAWPFDAHRRAGQGDGRWIDHAFVPTLLLQGATGTGQGLVARVMHDSAPRAPGRCITVNCAALPETRLEAALCGLAAGACTDARRPKRGLREEAAQGTRCLDESDTVPLPRQAKWRTVLEAKRARRLGAVADRAVDVTLSVATQTELSAAGSAGHFRLALLHRLAMVGRALPPWRERGAALLRLAPQCFLPAAASHGLVPQCRSPAAEAWRMDQDWPGNGRALRQLMERRTLLSPDAVREPPTLPQWCLPQPPPATRPPATLPPADRQP